MARHDHDDPPSSRADPREDPRDAEAARLIDAIYDTLDDGDPERALEMAHRGLRPPGGEEDPVLRSLAGVALLELGRPAEAVEELRRAVEMDPDDAEFRADLAHALFQACRFAEARDEARRALENDETCAAAHEVTALLLERAGDLAAAERHFVRAAALDPGSAPPLRLSRQAFEREVRRSGELLPEEFRRHLERVVVTVEDLPSDAILLEQQPPLDPGILGLFVGVALPERDTFSAGGELPPRILLFQRNLERLTADAEELRRQIAVTLYHELGHYLGFDEEGLEELDLA